MARTRMDVWNVQSWSEESGFQNCLDAVEKEYKHPKLTEPVIRREDLFSALWRTLISDQDHEQFKTKDLAVMWKDLSDVKNQSLDINDLNAVWTAWINKRTNREGLNAYSLRDWKASIATYSNKAIPEEYQLLLIYKETLDITIKGRKLFYTREGDMGLGPHAMMPGDYICLLPGGRTPYVLRKKSGTGQYELVGECYCHTLMEDAKLEASEPLRTFELV